MKEQQLPLPQPKEPKPPLWMTTLGLYFVMSPALMTVIVCIGVFGFPGFLSDSGWDKVLWIWGLSYLLLGPLIPMNGTQPPEVK